MSFLDDLMNIIGAPRPQPQGSYFGALNAGQPADETPGMMMQRSLANGHPMPEMSPAPSPPAASMAPPMGVGGSQQPAQAAPAQHSSHSPAQAESGSGYSVDRFGAFGSGFREGGLLGAITNATSGADRQEKAVNETYQFLVRKGVPEKDARALIQNPDLMKQVLPTLVGPKSSGTPTEIFDPKTGQPMKVLLQQDGSFTPLGGAKAAEPKRYSIGDHTPQEREAMAKQYGLDPSSDAGRSFVLTGKLPREDQQLLTATDKKAVLEADEMVQVNRGAIDALNEAKKLSPQANQGWFAAGRASMSNNLPNVLVPDFVSSPESGQATTNLDNAVIGTALAQLKSVFGGNPTEGERKILLELQGSSGQPNKVRIDIYNRAIALAEKRMVFNQQRADQLRGGTFYKPQGSAGGPQPAPGGVGGAPIRAKNAQTGQEIEWNGKDWVGVQ